MRALGLLLLFGCQPEEPLGPSGSWDVTLTCDDSTDGGEFPSCTAGALSLVDIDDDSLTSGTHRTLFPGHPRADGGYTGMPGPLSGAFEDGDIVLTLVGDQDDPFVGAVERQAWAAHVLELRGTYGSACWQGRFAWLTEDGTVDGEGELEAVRSGWECR